MQRSVFMVVAVMVVALVPVAALAADVYLGYNPNSVTTISGTVVNPIDYGINFVVPGQETMMISSNGQLYNVVLGPDWYNRSIGAAFTPGQYVTITGSSDLISGRRYVTASSVGMGDRMFTLRNSTGVPLWLSAPPIGAGPASAALVPFDASNLVHTSGHVRSIEMVSTPESSEPIVVAMIRGNRVFKRDVTQRVLLGPRSILDAKGIELGRGAKLDVNGSRVMLNGQWTIVATSVDYRDRSVILRSAAGAPRWSSAF